MKYGLEDSGEDQQIGNGGNFGGADLASMCRLLTHLEFCLFRMCDVLFCTNPKVERLAKVIAKEVLKAEGVVLDFVCSKHQKELRKKYRSAVNLVTNLFPNRPVW